ncbi:MAG: universal stress protein [Algoriphagus sp. 32-45-6]|jgi:nucleotide-binding universal stress UspA family protein|nr:MAG: universal stress protein [Algoriphagus sp. 32-45-6]
MKYFPKAMIGLDLTEMDDILIKKTAAYVEFLGIEKCYFLHVAKDLEIPQEILDQYPNLIAPSDESIEAIIKNKLQELNFPKHIEVEVFVQEGSHPLDTFLRWAKLKDVDLIIMGRKEDLAGSGVLANGVAKKAPCSILLFQEKRAVIFPKKIVIPTDFSQHNHMIYAFGERIAEELQAELVPVHLVKVPHGYSKTGKSYEEFAEIMKENALKDFKKYASKHNHSHLNCEILIDDERNPGEQIVEFAQKIGGDMLLLGSRGRTSSAAVILGSTAEKLIQSNKSLPMLIFKRKGETMGFFDALFKI